MTTNEKAWYERPITLRPSAHGRGVLIVNGEDGGGYLPRRTFWGSHEEQQADIAELYELLRTMPPRVHTKEENIAFRKDWDERYDRAHGTS